MDTKEIEILKDKRFCYYIPHDSGTDKGFIPSIVIEGESGHRPMTGGPSEFAVPYYWGDYETAKQVAAKRNADMGLSKKDVDEIICSSMFGSLA